MEQQRGGEGGRLRDASVKKDPGASTAQPWPIVTGAGTLVRLMAWMEGVGWGADVAGDLADRCTQNTSAATGLAAEHRG